ncbi:MAG: hypothetical protein U0792_16585 [Gemmataceae bacterium]
MGSTFATGLLTATFLGLVFVFGQDTQIDLIVPLAPAQPTEEIVEVEGYIELVGCEDVGQASDLESAQPENERIELVEPQPEATPSTGAATSGSR